MAYFSRWMMQQLATPYLVVCLLYLADTLDIYCKWFCEGLDLSLLMQQYVHPKFENLVESILVVWKRQVYEICEFFTSPFRNHVVITHRVEDWGSVEQNMDFIQLILYNQQRLLNNPGTIHLKTILPILTYNDNQFKFSMSLSSNDRDLSNQVWNLLINK